MLLFFLRCGFVIIIFVANWILVKWMLFGQVPSSLNLQLNNDQL